MIPAKNPSRECLSLKDSGRKMSKRCVSQNEFEHLSIADWTQAHQNTMCSNDLSPVRNTADRIFDLHMRCFPTNQALWMTKCFGLQ